MQPTSTIHRAARAALTSYELTGCKLRLLKRQGVVLFQVDAPGGDRYVLRMHPPDRHPRECLVSELQWLEHIVATTSLRVSAPLRATDESLVIDVESGALRFWCSLFRFIDSDREPDSRPLQLNETQACAIGCFLGELHECAVAFQPLDGFMRWEQEWITDDEIGEVERYGPKQLNAEDWDAVQEAIAFVRRVVPTIPKTCETFGLIHADPNLKNWLFYHDQVGLIDFEVCCFGLYWFDLASVWMGLLNYPNGDALAAALHDGYNSRRMAPPLDSDVMEALLMLNLCEIVGFFLGQPQKWHSAVVQKEVQEALGHIRRSHIGVESS